MESEKEDTSMEDMLLKMKTSDEEPLLFMTDEEIASMKERTDLQAILNIDYEGTPEEVAENWKNKGNEYFKKGKNQYKEAIGCYTKALEQRSSDLKANSTYMSNRAACNLTLGNYGRVIEDCNVAIRLWDGNIKAYFRAAKACRALEKYKEAIVYCERGLKKDENNKEFVEEIAKIKKDMEKKQRKEIKSRKESTKQVEELQQYYQRMEEQLSSRGIVLGRYLYDLTQSTYYEGGKIYIDEANLAHFPVLFIYEEHNQSDFIQDFSEDHTFAQHLAYMFPPESDFALWDSERKYVLDDIEILVEVGTTKPLNASKYGDKYDKVKKRWVKVRKETPLKKVLTHPDYVVPGIPVFHIVVAGSKFKEEILKRTWD